MVPEWTYSLPAHPHQRQVKSDQQSQRKCNPDEIPVVQLLFPACNTHVRLSNSYPIPEHRKVIYFHHWFPFQPRSGVQFQLHRYLTDYLRPKNLLDLEAYWFLPPSQNHHWLQSTPHFRMAHQLCQELSIEPIASKFCHSFWAHEFLRFHALQSDGLLSGDIAYHKDTRKNL